MGLIFNKSCEASSSLREGCPSGYQNETVPTQTPREVFLIRLDAGAYRELLKSLGGAALPAVTSQTTELQAGEQIGVQRVLRALREGFVVSS